MRGIPERAVHNLSRVLTLLMAISLGLALVLQNPDFAPFAPVNPPTASVYLLMTLLGASVVWTWSSLGELLVGFVVSLAILSIVFAVLSAWALAATGVPSDVIGGWVARPLIGYLLVTVPLMGLGGIVVGVWKS